MDGGFFNVGSPLRPIRNGASRSVYSDAEP